MTKKQADAYLLTFCIIILYILTALVLVIW